MKRLLPLLLVLSLCQAALAGATAQDQTDLRLVVQQNGQALVTEGRSLTLAKGVSLVVLPDLPATIEAQTLQVRSRTDAKGLHILDLALDEDLLTPANLLRRYAGRQVTVVLPDGKSTQGRVQKQALVLSSDEPPLFLIDGQVYSGPVEAIFYPELPQGMSPRPRLSLNVDNAGPTRQELELCYMVRELGWRMDYVLTLNKAGTSGLLSGWATISNRTGRDYPGAVVELLAGEPRSVQPAPVMRTFAAAPDGMGMTKAMAAAGSEELFEYHLYKLKRPLNLSDKQSRQAPLFESATIPVTRRLIGRWGALPSGREADPATERLDAVLSFRNTEAANLGLPLPRGVLRAFQEEDGARHLLGEAQLPRTAVGGNVELRLGQAFDVSVERVVTDYERSGKTSYRAAWELRISNGRRQAQSVVLQEQLPGKWKIESASAKWTKTSSGVAEFVVDVPPTREGEPFVLRYSFSAEL